MSRADIGDPAAIRDARRSVLRFGEIAEGALGGAAAGMQRMRDRLRLELLPQWKHQAARRQEAWQEARRRYLEAEDDVRRARQSTGVGRASSDDERRAMNKAKARWEEAEEKLVAIRRWLLRLDDVGDALANRCLGHSLALGELVAACAVRLEQAAQAIDDYHAAVLPAGGPPHG